MSTIFGINYFSIWFSEPRSRAVCVYCLFLLNFMLWEWSHLSSLSSSLEAKIVIRFSKHQLIWQEACQVIEISMRQATHSNMLHAPYQRFVFLILKLFLVMFKSFPKQSKISSRLWFKIDSLFINSHAWSLIALNVKARTVCLPLWPTLTLVIFLLLIWKCW